MTGLRDISIPSVGANWDAYGTALDLELRARSAGVWQIDDPAFGSTDDEKHVNAWNAARSATRKPVLQYPARTFGPLSTPIATFDGMRAIGPDGNDGVKNLELSSGNLVNHRVRIQAGTGTSALFQQTGTLQDIVFANIAFSGSASSQFWHNTNGNSYSIYPIQFHSLSFDGFSSVLGNTSQKFTMTQGLFTGHWTVLNYQNTPLRIGGSDNMLWMGGMLNSNSPASVAGAGKPIVHFDYMEKTQVGFLYITAENAWSGIRVEGPVERELRFFGGEFEGRGASNPATYPVIDIRGGHVIMYGPGLGYVVNTNANGAIVQSGGVFELYNAHYRKATSAETTFPMFYQTGGLAHISRPLSANGNAIRLRWKDAALGSQDQDIAYPTGNSVTSW